MCNTLELSGLLAYLGDLLSFPVPGGQKKLLDCGLLGGISTQADAMDVFGTPASAERVL